MKIFGLYNLYAYIHICCACMRACVRACVHVYV